MEVRGKVLANGVNILPGVSALALMAKHKPRTLRLDSKLAISSGFLGPFARTKTEAVVSRSRNPHRCILYRTRSGKQKHALYCMTATVFFSNVTFSDCLDAPQLRHVSQSKQGREKEEKESSRFEPIWTVVLCFSTVPKKVRTSDSIRTIKCFWKRERRTYQRRQGGP
jgi:hypothetical protein